MSMPVLERSFAYSARSSLTVPRLDRSCGLIPMAVPVFESHTKYSSSEFTKEIGKRVDVVYGLVAMGSSSTSE